jgi:hypothetical protein
VGRDNISDFTTNLIKDFLCHYTETFAATYLPDKAIKEVWVDRAVFHYQTQSWARKRYALPRVDGDYIILTPKDMLTRDENWINRKDLVGQFEEIPEAIPDPQLRASVFVGEYEIDLLECDSDRKFAVLRVRRTTSFFRIMARLWELLHLQ